jgi:hypothetical protein
MQQRVFWILLVFLLFGTIVYGLVGLTKYATDPTISRNSAMKSQADRILK